MSVPFPEVPDSCWEIDEGCCANWEDYDSDVTDRATFLATSTLRSLTGYIVGGCPVTVRPCSQAACDSIARYGADYWISPILWAGTWSNCGCTSGCIHNGLTLPRPVGYVAEVKVDGVVLASNAYRVLNGNILIRTDGQRWPTTQDLTKDDTETGTWSVTYLNGYPVDANGAYAAGILACEFAKACSGGACALPPGVTSIIRQGVAMSIPTGAFPDGLTGIRAVDAYIRAWNPHGLKSRPSVWTPNSGRKVTSWQ